MIPKHHISETILLDFVSGRLGPDFSYVVNCHLHNCRMCDEQATALMGIGGTALDALEPTPMKSTADDLLKIISDKNNDKKRQTTTKPSPNIPSKTELFDENILRKLKYQFLAPGIRQHIFKLSESKISAISARILWIDAGVAVPSHGHGGTELTQVLVGGYFDGDQEFTKGDVQVVSHVAPHQPKAMNDGPCMVLAAAESPLKFQHSIPKSLQPFFKI